jgi:glycosyltransferase involved in cell wall biosynthesis/GT2 family glycosyltransferase
LFIYDPRPLWRALGNTWDVLDIHEEPFALATAEVLAIRALRRQRVPYVVYSAQNIDKRLPAPFRWLQRRVLGRAAAVSVCSVAAGEIVQRRGFPGRPDVVPLGVETPEPTTGRDLSARGRVVGYAGRLADHKGVDVLLQAVAGLPDSVLLLAGAGPAEDGLRRRAARSDLTGRVRFLGPLHDGALAEFYAGLDVLAVPSRTTADWVEQFGRVAVEAMAHGVPVVASDSGALPDVVGEAGLLVPPDDPVALRNALGRMLGDVALRERSREAGYRIAASCRWDVVADRYVDIYRRVTRTGEARALDRAVEVVVVAYGTPERLRPALAPLEGMPVTVVDNSASQQVRQVCAASGVRYLDARGNRGFGGGVNLALSDRLDATADVLLLNPDAIVSADDVAALHRALLADPSLASVGPAQVDEAGAPSRVGWPFPSPLRTWVEAVGLGRVVGNRTDFAIGSVLLLRSEALAEVGGFDERFFLYAEETDWAYRAARLGWRHAVVPSVTAFHAGGAASNDPAQREAHFHGSQERYLRKHFGTAGWQVARAGQLAGSAARAVLPGSRGIAARDRVRRYLRGPVAVERAYRSIPELVGDAPS